MGELVILEERGRSEVEVVLLLLMTMEMVVKRLAKLSPERSQRDGRSGGRS